MTKNKLVVLTISLCLILALAVTSSMEGCAKPAAAEPIVIGHIANFTGPSTAETPFVSNAVKLAIDKYNWEIAGRPIKLVEEDSAFDPTLAVDKARKLVEVDKASLIIGPLGTPLLVAVSNYLAGTGVPHIWGIYGLEEEAKLGDNIFQPHGTLQFSGYLAGEYAAKVLGYKTAVVIHDDFSGGETLAQGGMDGFVANGGTIIQRLRTPMDIMDYGPYITQLKKADFVLCWFVPIHLQQFITQASQFGLDMPIIESGACTLGGPVLSGLGDKAVGVRGTDVFDAFVETPAVKAYVDKWVEKYGNLPEEQGSYPAFSESDCAYVSTLVALEGLKVAGGDTTPAVLNLAIKNVKVSTPWGPLSFDADRIGIGPSFVWEVVKDTKDGQSWYHRKGILTFEVQPLRQDPKTVMIAPKM
jgi:branched-chain amino acid transport system substrate-binding protein